MNSDATVSRRGFLAGALGVAGIGALAACSSTSPGGGSTPTGGAATTSATTAKPAPEGTGQIWIKSGGSLDKVIEDSINRFSATSTSGKLELYVVPANEGINDKVRTVMNTPNRPDAWYHWSGGSNRDYAQAGILRDLGPLLEANPEWTDKFIKGVMDVGITAGKQYGVPMRGVMPCMLYYNKSMFADAGVKPPEELDDLFDLIDVFKGRGVLPLILAGGQGWTELLYLEYFVDRIGGPALFDRIAEGDSQGWADPAILEAATRCVELVDRGAFGDAFQSVVYEAGTAPAMFAQGKGAMQLQLASEFTTQLAQAPEFARTDLAFAPFPSINGGKGDPMNIVGNPNNYYSIVEGDFGDACADYFIAELASDTYIEDLIKVGEIPGLVDLESTLAELHPEPDYAKTIYDITVTAPHFTMAWDQALGRAKGEVVTTGLQKLFNKEWGPQDFVDSCVAGA